MLIFPEATNLHTPSSVKCFKCILMKLSKWLYEVVRNIYMHCKFASTQVWCNGIILFYQPITFTVSHWSNDQGISLKNNGSPLSLVRIPTRAYKFNHYRSNRSLTGHFLLCWMRSTLTCMLYVGGQIAANLLPKENLALKPPN